MAGTRNRWVRSQRSGDLQDAQFYKNVLLTPFCLALYRMRLETPEVPVSRNLQSGDPDAPSPIESGQELGEGHGARRAEIRKASWRRGIGLGQEGGEFYLVEKQERVF